MTTTAFRTYLIAESAQIGCDLIGQPLGFDTFIGTAIGTLNRVDGSFLRFIFVDIADLGSTDKVPLQIWLPGANPNRVPRP